MTVENENNIPRISDQAIKGYNILMNYVLVRTVLINFATGYNNYYIRILCIHAQMHLPYFTENCRELKATAINESPVNIHLTVVLCMTSINGKMKIFEFVMQTQ